MHLEACSAAVVLVEVPLRGKLYQNLIWFMGVIFLDVSLLCKNGDSVLSLKSLKGG